MKWGENNEMVVERVASWLGKTVGVRVIYALMILSAFVLMSGANDKWR